MIKFANIYVGEERVATCEYDTESPKAAPWEDLASNPFIIVDVTEMPVIPARGDVWEDGQFKSPSGMHRQDPNGVVNCFAFVIDGKCVHTELLHKEGQLPLIAAFKTGIRVEVI